MQTNNHNESMNTKQKILRAAAQIINTKGVLTLTLEAVAKKAKISKGGLLYHFPSKDALMKGLNDYLIQGFANDVERAANEDPCEKGKWTRAYITKTVAQFGSEVDMNVAFLSAAATNPNLLKPMAEHLQALQAHIEDDHIDPIVSTVIRLAIDGMYFNQLFGLNLKEDAHDKVLNYLITLTKEDTK